MISHCEECGKYFEDIYRSTACPHDAFPANDGNNNFRIHDDAYLGDQRPELPGWPDRITELRKRGVIE